jgi:hypothetical protein
VPVLVRSGVLNVLPIVSFWGVDVMYPPGHGLRPGFIDNSGFLGSHDPYGMGNPKWYELLVPVTI